MNPSTAIRWLAAAGSGLIFASHLSAVTIHTLGAGSATAIVDRSATFDTLNATNVVDLGNYSEGGLFITTGMTSWADDVNMAAKLDPFHGATAPDRAFFCVSWDNPEWTSIRTTNQALMHGAEFTYGNGWTTGDVTGQYPWGNSDAILVWETWRSSAIVSSGNVGGSPLLPVGTVVGFYDAAGFDELLVKAIMSTAANTNSNALALDDLHVMLANVPPKPAIYGSDFSVEAATGLPSLTIYDTIAGCRYRLVYQETLTEPNWTPVTSPPPDGWQPGGGTLTLSDPSAPGRPQRLYRVEVQ